MKVLVNVVGTGLVFPVQSMVLSGPTTGGGGGGVVPPVA